MNERRELLRAVDQYSFAMYDLQLYLDTHPHSMEAMNRYRKYKALKKSAEEKYVRLYGPLKAEQAAVSDSWNWKDSPWPWEKEGN